jgi:dUTP pyrophosphatase
MEALWTEEIVQSMSEGVPFSIFVKRLDPTLPLPKWQKPGDAGFDLYSAADTTLMPGERALVRTGIAVAIPKGYAGFVQPRSGLAWKRGLTILNTPGLIDSGYRGEVQVILINLDRSEPIRISRGERIAQLVVLRIQEVILEEVDDLPTSERGTGGLGSTGV